MLDEMPEGIGATKSEIIDAIHAGANQSEIARLERAIWRLFDRTSGIDRLIKDRQRLRNALQQIANGDGIYGMQAGEYKQIARKALGEA